MSGKASGTANSKEKRSLIVWLILAVPLVLALILFTIPSFTPRVERVADNDDVRRSATASSVTETEAVSRQIVGGVVCPSYSRERRTCTFDSQPTAGFGSSERTSSFCYDKPFGADQEYTRQRWDPASRKWVNWERDGDYTVAAQRFIGNRGQETVTVSYWIPDGPSCTSPEPLKEERNVNARDESASTALQSSSPTPAAEPAKEEMFTSSPGDYM
ncbi:MAG TPA: hypothetical protein VFY28_01265 [Candidatus Paceibacterota bacterium]|nr:hypothetical protein [Candidatus Paceibacterota bacterium]